MSTALLVPGRGATPGRATPVAAIAVLAVVVVTVSLASVLIGARSLPLAALIDRNHPLHAVYDARLARTVLGLCVGAALGMAGALLQGLTRNPLADPGILGINAGASFAMIAGLTWLGATSLSAYLWFAFAGAAGAALLVHALASLGRDGATPVKVAITGAALTAALTSWTSGILLTDRQTLETFRFWQVGTIGGRGYEVLLTGLPFLIIGGLLALACGPILNALAMGDDLARGLGRRTARDRLVVGVAVVLLAGTSVALAGPIAFVGLLVPHGVRAVVGSDYRRVLPLCAGYGAALVVAADTLGRIVLPPAEVQVGIMTAVVGVPFFLVLIRRGRMAAL